VCTHHLEDRSNVCLGALPAYRNSPQKPPFGLYAEKLSGTAFTAPRHENKQSWLYRILPSCAHQNFVPLSISEAPHLWTSKFHQIPNQLRWDPFDEDPSKDFIHGLNMVGGAGEPATKMGLGIYIYACGKSMGKQAFYNADGDFLIVPERGTLDIQTELGHLLVRNNEIVVIPRGIRFRVLLPDGSSRGYILEIYTNHFELPELGPIGSNGLANARDFQAPVASFEDDTSEWEIIAKFDRQLHMAKQGHSPFDVVAWHGVQTFENGLTGSCITHTNTISASSMLSDRHLLTTQYLTCLIFF
jgi:homogentisate 1,2-dioxygenase